MDLPFLMQCTINAVVLASTYILMATGLSLIFSILKIINFAHGEFYMLGAFSVYYTCKIAQINFFASLVIAMIILFGLGTILERKLWKPLRDQELPTVILSFGVLLLLQGIAMLIFGEKDKAVPSAFEGKITLWGASITWEKIATILVAAGTILFLHLMIRRTKIGKAMRAVAQDREAASAQGIRVNRIMSLGFGLGCSLAALAGALMAPAYFVNPYIGVTALINSFIVVVLGGLGNILGAVVGGLVLGFIQSFIGVYLGGLYHIFALLLIVVLLVVKPQGLLGHG